MCDAALRPLAEHRFDAILFDLDGTLIDSTAAVRRAWARWASEERVDPALLPGLAGRPAKEIVAELVAPHRAPAALERYTRIAERLMEGVTVLAGSYDALATTDGRMAIVTSSSRTVAQARMAASGLTEPPVMVTAEDVTRGKPEPEPYLRGAERLGAEPARCLAVEDSAAGVASARAAGCVTLGVSEKPVDKLGADFQVADLTAVVFLAENRSVVVRQPAQVA